MYVSPNLALLGAQHSFELERTLGAQDPLSVKIYLTRWTPFVLDNLTNKNRHEHYSNVKSNFASLGKQHLVC